MFVYLFAEMCLCDCCAMSSSRNQTNGSQLCTINSVLLSRALFIMSWIYDAREVSYHWTVIGIWEFIECVFWYCCEHYGLLELTPLSQLSFLTYEVVQVWHTIAVNSIKLCVAASMIMLIHTYIYIYILNLHFLLVNMPFIISV